MKFPLKFSKKIILLCFFMLYAICSASALIIYRPINDGYMNEIPCYIKVEDEEGNEIKLNRETVWYEWVEKPGYWYLYKKSFYLKGGMAIHIPFNPGRYKITVYTPKDKQFGVECANKREDWVSNEFVYDTNYPLNVSFVTPTSNENYFYNGGWVIDNRAPKFFIYTRPKITS